MLITNWVTTIAYFLCMILLGVLWYNLWKMVKKEHHGYTSFWNFYLFECNIFSRVCNWIVSVIFVYNICRVVYTILYVIRN